MIDHTGIGVADVARSALFYDAALGALGLRRCIQLPADDGRDGIGYGVDFPIFWIDRFHPAGVHQHTAFRAANHAEVDAFHAAAIAAGGTDNGAPGLRSDQGYPVGYYAAFVPIPTEAISKPCFAASSSASSPRRARRSTDGPSSSRRPCDS
jgi:catechol 2,3-dioxygenase-like lactoylglutathione lyase family enzyme